jgi:cellulose biosynthesis protein BcsQ
VGRRIAPSAGTAVSQTAEEKIMTRAELRERIAANLSSVHLEINDIRVQPDPYGGWRVLVISKDFEGRSSLERKRAALAGIEGETVEWADLMTPNEAAWGGPLLSESDLSDLPLWSEALARASDTSERKPEVLFPSDLDEDLPSPVAVTFYSVRGGVGRSTALAYVGRILAARGYKVVCVDLDLEAPGLAALFGLESQTSDAHGVVPLLMALERGEKPDLSKHLIRVDESSEIYCLPAGRPGAEYARLLRFVMPSAWYTEERNPLRDLMTGLAEGLPFKPDVLLLDSRTGISEISAPLLFDLSDLSVIVFFPHPQTQRATGEVVRALLASRTQRRLEDRRLTPEPRFLVSPVPSARVPEVVERYRNRSAEWVADWLSAAKRNGEAGGDALNDMLHFVPYRDEIATSDSVLSDSQIWQDYEPVADWVERFLPEGDGVSRPVIARLKPSILEELHFSAGTAEDQEDFLSTFVETGTARKALDPGIPLVLGRKGVGKTAVFRRLLERSEPPSIPITAPAPLRGGRPWILNADAFQEVDSVLARRNANWRQFWNVMLCLACRYSWPESSIDFPMPDDALAAQIPGELRSPLETVRLVERLFDHEGISLLAVDWLERIEAAARPLLLLFDGLDTGFGNSAAERERRRNVIEGLFGLITDRSERKGSIRFKVVLREDIWRSLRFENKSHFFGRSVTLEWKDQTSYYKVVLKQALRSGTFRQLVQTADQAAAVERLDDWSEREVGLVWNLLVGERMKGEKTAFTRNWVWNRLADANEDHGPRYLLQLFREAADWERIEQRNAAYDRSIIRPRAFVQSLPAVSRQALEALQEEFPELDSLLVRLREIGRTPVDAHDLGAVSDSVSLAREVGLLGIYEGTEDRVERYRIPEIYRYALEMTRKGQA